jgi:hypothetical protein
MAPILIASVMEVFTRRFSRSYLYRNIDKNCSPKMASKTKMLVDDEPDLLTTARKTLEKMAIKFMLLTIPKNPYDI